MKTGKDYKFITRLLKALLLVTTLIYPAFMDIMTALGWSANIQSYGYLFRTYAVMLAVGAILVTAGTILVFFKKDIAAVVCGLLGGIFVSVSAYRAVAVAEVSGWASPTEADFGKHAATLWSQRLYPTWVPIALLVLLSLLHFFSYDAALAREVRRKAKIDKENQPAPKIVED